MGGIRLFISSPLMLRALYVDRAIFLISYSGIFMKQHPDNVQSSSFLFTGGVGVQT